MGNVRQGLCRGPSMSQPTVLIIGEGDSGVDSRGKLRARLDLSNLRPTGPGVDRPVYGQVVVGERILDVFDGVRKNPAGQGGWKRKLRRRSQR